MHNYLVARSSDLHAKGLYLESTDLIGPGLLNVTSILPLFFYNDEELHRNMSGCFNSGTHLQLIVPCHWLFTNPKSAPGMI